MSVVRMAALVFSALLAVLPSGAGAAPFSVRLGIEKLVLDAPDGFTDTLDLASPRLREIGESLVSASNRILLFALSDAELRRFQHGESLDEKQRYLLVATPRSLERERVTSEQFAGMVALSQRDLGTPPQGDVLQYLAKQPPGRANFLTELRKDTTIFSVLQGTKIIPAQGGGFLSKEKPAQYVLSTTTLLLVRGKALQLTAFTRLDSPADMDWIKAITERWVGELQRLNGR